MEITVLIQSLAKSIRSLDRTTKDTRDKILLHEIHLLYHTVGYKYIIDHFSVTITHTSTKRLQ